MFKTKLCSVLAAIMLLTACAATPTAEAVAKSATAAKTALPAAKTKSGNKLGIASYYADKFHGRRTASGERYNKNAYTAAHKTLPFGTYVLVTKQSNGRKVIVKINDRGPYTQGRIIDLSKKAARDIGLVGKGVAKVKIEKIQVDKRGYLVGKNAAMLYKLARQQKLPLKLKKSTKSTKTSPKTK